MDGLQRRAHGRIDHYAGITHHTKLLYYGKKYGARWAADIQCDRCHYLIVFDYIDLLDLYNEIIRNHLTMSIQKSPASLMRDDITCRENLVRIA